MARNTNKITIDDETNDSKEKNPFSFKKFIKKQSPADFFEAELPSVIPEKNSKLSDYNVDKPRKESNPLSFKEFMKQDPSNQPKISCDVSFSPPTDMLPSPPDFYSIKNKDFLSDSFLTKLENNSAKNRNEVNDIQSFLDQENNSCDESKQKLKLLSYYQNSVLLITK